MVLRIARSGKITKKDIEDKITGVGDYVKIDHLTRFLQEPLEQEIRRFALTTLSDLYAAKSMFSEAGKLMRAAGDLHVTFKDKIDSYTCSAELFIKAGLFSEADYSFIKALENANIGERAMIKQMQKHLYLVQAKELLSRDKRGAASLVYEKILALDLTNEEKNQFQKILLSLYEKLGKIREFSMLNHSIESGETTRKQHEQEAMQKQKYSPSVDELIGL